MLKGKEIKKNIFGETLLSEEGLEKVDDLLEYFIDLRFANSYLNIEIKYLETLLEKAKTRESLKAIQKQIRVINQHELKIKNLKRKFMEKINNSSIGELIL